MQIAITQEMVLKTIAIYHYSVIKVKASKSKTEEERKLKEATLALFDDMLSQLNDVLQNTFSENLEVTNEQV